LNKEMEKGLNNTLFTPSGCLTEKGLSLYTHGLLTEEETGAIRSHLKACEMCAAAAEGFLLAGQEAFTEDVSFLNSGFAGLSFNEEKTQETALSEESRIPVSRVPVISRGEIKQPAEGLSAKAVADKIPTHEREPKPVSLPTGKTIFHRYQYRLLAAVILLLVGFGSILLYLQIKHSTVNNNTAGLIEKSDTISHELTITVPVDDKKVLTEKKEQPVQSYVKEPDSGKVITITLESKVSPIGYADHHVDGLIDKSSYPKQTREGIAPSLGMPLAATPEAPQVTGNQKLPVRVFESEAEVMIVSTENDDAETAPDNMDKKVLRETRKQSLTANEEYQEAEIFTVVEESPHFPGGEDAVIKFLQENLKYPVIARESSIQGTVFITFVIEKDGTITDIRVLRGIGGGCDEEALRALKLMPRWIPGKQRGKPVRVQFNLPVKFSLAG